VALCSVVFRRRWCDHPPGLTVNFRIIFAVLISFVSRLNRKIRVLRLLVTVRVFCLLKTAVKCTQTYHFVDKKDIFWGSPSTTATPLDAYGASPLLTEILNTPLALCTINLARKLVPPPTESNSVIPEPLSVYSERYDTAFYQYYMRDV